MFFSAISMFASAFLRNTKGNVAMIAGVLAPALMGAGAVAVDYTIFANQRSALQQAADSAALASAKEMGLSGANEHLIKEVGKAFAASSFLVGDQLTSDLSSFTTEVTPSMNDREVRVDLAFEWKPFLAHVFDYRVTPIKVTATAGLANSTLTCIVGLMQPQRLAKSSIHLDDRSVVEADNCAVYSNSISKYGLRADSASSMTASSICSAGGVLQFGWGTSANFQPQPITDCPQVEDPLADRRAPIVGSCDFKSLSVTESAVLEPGVYCGGLTISGSANVKLRPGLYIMDGGPLTVADEASFHGEDITFFLTGEGSVFDFQADTSISLSAATEGPTAGLLFFEDRNVNHSFDFNPFMLNRLPSDVRLHRISSNDARNLLGTIYLSKSILLIDADAPVADSSAYTAIVTGRLWLREGPILSLNADLTETEVPVPGGLVGTEPKLVY